MPLIQINNRDWINPDLIINVRKDEFAKPHDVERYVRYIINLPEGITYHVSEDQGKRIIQAYCNSGNYFL